MAAPQEALTYFASRRDAAFVLAGSIAFVVGGYVMRVERPVLGWLSVGFFSLGILAGLTRLLSPKSSSLRLDREGFEIREVRGTTRLKWSDVARFELGSINGVKMISIIYAAHYGEQQTGRAIAESLSGMQGAIADIYTVPIKELLDTLNEWRARSDSR